MRTTRLSCEDGWLAAGCDTGGLRAASDPKVGGQYVAAKGRAQGRDATWQRCWSVQGVTWCLHQSGFALSLVPSSSSSSSSSSNNNNKAPCFHPHIAVLEKRF